MSLEQFARLTDRQIFELYLHPRDKEGAIALDEPVIDDEAEGIEQEDTRTPYEQDLDALEGARESLYLNRAHYEALKAELDAKYGRTAPDPG